MNDEASAGRRARGFLLAGATVLGLLVLLTALAVRAQPGAAAGGELRRTAGGTAQRQGSETVPPAEPEERREPEARAATALAPKAAHAEPALNADGEQEHCARFRALLAQDDGALERAAPSILLGDAPVSERVGLLRALEEGGSGEATRLLDLALRSGPPLGGSGPVQDFALRSLRRRAPDDAAARAALRAAAFGPRAAPDGALRRRAAGHLAATATEDELAAGFPELDAEPDPLVVQAFESALAERRSQSSPPLDLQHDSTTSSQ